MNRLPRLASAVLHALGIDPAVIGDLEETSRAGRSRFWCWRQVAGILFLGPLPPFVIGWSMLLITFALFHMAVAGPLWITARQTGQWTPTLVALLVGGYAGFALAAWFITRFHRRATAAALISQTARVVLMTVLVVIIVELCGAAWVLLAAAAPAPPQQVEWSDSSPHQTTLITVEDDVRLEVLDWGGSGRSLLLLAGLGDTAHVFDDVAPMLATRYRVVGVTRRGHPRSSAPAGGYGSLRLAEDVVRVMDAVGLKNPVVVGHSFAGEEMHVLGDRYSTRIAGLVYVDAAFNRADDFEEHEAAARALPAPPGPEPADLASFATLRAFLTRTQGPPGPEGRLRARYVANADGSVQCRWTPDPHVFQAFSNEMRAMTVVYDPKRIRVPGLAIYAVPKSAAELMRPWYNADDPAVRERVETLYPLERENVARHAKWVCRVRRAWAHLGAFRRT